MKKKHISLNWKCGEMMHKAFPFPLTITSKASLQLMQDKVLHFLKAVGRVQERNLGTRNSFWYFYIFCKLQKNGWSIHFTLRVVCFYIRNLGETECDAVVRVSDPGSDSLTALKLTKSPLASHTHFLNSLFQRNPPHIRGRLGNTDH